jgi:hypothetical protein
MSFDKLVEYATTELNFLVALGPAPINPINYGFVTFNAMGSACAWLNIITIEGNPENEETLHVLAHELGHLILENNRPRYWRKYMNWCRVNKNTSKRARIGVIQLERDAWRFGASLLRYLGIPYNRHEFGKRAIRSLDTYTYNKYGYPRINYCKED